MCFNFFPFTFSKFCNTGHYGLPLLFCVFPVRLAGILTFLDYNWISSDVTGARHFI